MRRLERAPSAAALQLDGVRGMLNTDYVPCVYYARESGGGAPWIEIGYFQTGIPALEIVRLGLTFRSEITPDCAGEIAGELYDTFEGLRCLHNGWLGMRPAGSGLPTDESPCTFKVVNPDEGRPWVAIQYYVSGLPALDVVSLGLTFRGDVTPERAEEVAGGLRQTFRYLRCTLLGA